MLIGFAEDEPRRVVTLFVVGPPRYRSTWADAVSDGVMLCDMSDRSGNGVEVHQLHTPAGYPSQPSRFAPDGTLAVGAQNGGSVSLWDRAATGPRRAVLGTQG